MGQNPSTLKALESKGLIEGYDTVLYGKGNSPIDRIPISIRKYDMPIAEHIEFCQWCSLHSEIDGE
jgi:hypothetical protein